MCVPFTTTFLLHPNYFTPPANSSHHHLIIIILFFFFTFSGSVAVQALIGWRLLSDVFIYCGSGAVWVVFAAEGVTLPGAAWRGDRTGGVTGCLSAVTTAECLLHDRQISRNNYTMSHRPGIREIWLIHSLLSASGSLSVSGPRECVAQFKARAAETYRLLFLYVFYMNTSSLRPATSCVVMKICAMLG